MSIYTVVESTLIIFGGVVSTGIAVLAYIGYREDKKISESEKRAKTSILEDIVKK